MSAPEDFDWLFLESMTALAEGIIELANGIKDESDAPGVLEKALIQESKALIIQKWVRDYRGRLRELKAAAAGNREWQGRQEVVTLAEAIIRAAQTEKNGKGGQAT